MSREGRSQPIQPFAAHGFVDSGVGVPGTAPPPPSVVENDERLRRRTLPLPPVVLSGAFAPAAPPVVAPPTPTVIPVSERARVTPSPTSSSGFDLVTPPEANVVEPKDSRRQTPDPVSIRGSLAGLVAPFVQVPPPVVTENDDKRRRYPPPDPSAVNAALLAIQSATPTAAPPGPFVVPLEQRRRLLETLAVAEHGFVDPGPGPVGTTPPPPTNVDRADQRTRYLPLPPLVLSGVLIPFVPPPPVTVLGGTDWAAAITSSY